MKNQTDVTATAKERERIRGALRPRAPIITLLANNAVNAIEGPDPEAALEYLKRLRAQCDEALRLFSV